jgi:hypothetical protein
MMTTTMPIASVEQDTIQEEETDDSNHDKQKKSVEPKSSIPQMTDEEQIAYEQKIMANIQKMSQQNLLNSITCCITKSILHDPGN